MIWASFELSCSGNQQGSARGVVDIMTFHVYRFRVVAWKRLILSSLAVSLVFRCGDSLFFKLKFQRTSVTWPSEKRFFLQKFQQGNAPSRVINRLTNCLLYPDLKAREEKLHAQSRHWF